VFQQQRVDEAGDRGIAGENTNDVSAAFDFAVQPLDRVGGVELGAVLLGEGHAGQHVSLSVIYDGRQLWHLRPDLVSDGTPLSAGGLGGVLGKGCGDEG